ncbi:MAG: hypothetical protein EAX96_20545 [Candidatus Lokiarchaeota archaeon]|nr:hypothetical protein [Candidatus Lokiarchaeota archaeon]
MKNSVEERIANYNFQLESLKQTLIYYLKYLLETNDRKDSEDLMKKFNQTYEKLLKEQTREDDNKLTEFYRYLTNLKPALNTILEPGKLYDSICDTWVFNFNIILDRVRRQLNDKKFTQKQKGPIIPGSSKSMDLRYYCTVCEQNFEIPQEIKAKLMDDSEKIELPKHHDKEMVIKIVKIEEEKENEPFEEIKIYPAEMLLSHTNSSDGNVEYLKILSVGIDVGSSTSHLIFSRLTYKREASFFNMTNRFLPINREIIYESDIIFTPLIDRYNIDIEAVIKFCEDEYKKAGILPEMVDTGAVIVTGETAKKENAAEIVVRISSESGKFVSAAAGPNFESLLGAMGSGIVERSRMKHCTILNVDVGGGTSNMAICSNGDVVSTACINVGGRLLGIDKNFKIWRIDEPSYRVMKELNMNYQLGDTIPEEDVRTIAHEYANALIEVMKGSATSPIAKMLMMTDNLDQSIPFDEISISGGIGEIIYTNQTPKNFNDIGKYLAEEIKNILDGLKLQLVEPENKIRATVIGAGAFSLSISGSTCYFDKGIDFPLNNIPVIPVPLKKEVVCDLIKDEVNSDYVKEEIEKAYKNFDFQEGEDIIALYFKDPIHRSTRWMPGFAKAIEKSLPHSIANKKPIILLFYDDVAKLMGLAINRETSIQNLMCLDELILEAGVWIDIGAPLKSGRAFGAQLESAEAFPVTVKSLVFNNEKKDS